MGNMNNDWLKQLAPDHAPAAVGWWPIAPGWWGLVVLLVIAIAGLIYWLSRPPRRLRRLALRELSHIEQSIHDDAALARELEHLLRRYALTRFGRAEVAGLSGSNWIAFVVAHGGQAWAGDSGSKLLQAAYGGKVQADRTNWLKGARAFIQGKAIQNHALQNHVLQNKATQEKTNQDNAMQERS